MRKVIAIMFLTSSALYANYNLSWYSIYNNSAYGGYDWTSDIVADSEGNYYVTGTSGGCTERGSCYDMITIKYNSIGDTLWIRGYSYFDLSIEHAVKICIDKNNNIYIGGYGNSLNQFYYNDFIILKYNSDGDLLWINRIADSIYNRSDFVDMIVDENEIYYSGYTIGQSIRLFKITFDGNIVWESSYPSLPLYSYYPYPIGSLFKDDNNIYFIGSAFDSSSSHYKYLVLKYDLNGNIIWTKMSNSEFDSYGYSILSDEIGNIYASGYSKISKSNNNSAMKLLKLDSNGNIIWEKLYDGKVNFNTHTTTNNPNMLFLDNENNIYVNFSMKRSFDKNDNALVKIDSSGNEIWLKRYNYNSVSAEMATDFKSDGKGNLFICSSSSTGVLNSNTFVILHYNFDGVLKNEIRNMNSFNYAFYPASLFVSNNLDIVVTGSVFPGISMEDIFTIKYSYSVGITQTSSTIPSSFSLSQNYPNPFNPTTNIRFQIPESGFVTLKVFDITGREVATLVNEQMNAGEYNYQFSIDNYQLGSGVYFYKCTVNDKNGKMNFSETKKMVVMR